MKLYVMRHGPAEDRAESGVDADRALSTEGRGRVVAVARRLVEACEEPAVVISSPLVRAVQTAEIVAIGTDLSRKGGTVEVSREVAPGGDALRLVHRLIAGGVERVMLVGHEPDLSVLVSSLLGRFARSFDKAMVVGIQLTQLGSHPCHAFVLDPKSLELQNEIG